MKWRKISREETEMVIKEPDKVEVSEKGRKNAFKRLGGRYFRITYKELENEILIISVIEKFE